MNNTRTIQLLARLSPPLLLIAAASTACYLYLQPSADQVFLFDTGTLLLLLTAACLGPYCLLVCWILPSLLKQADRVTLLAKPLAYTAAATATLGLLPVGVYWARLDTLLTAQLTAASEDRGSRVLAPQTDFS